MIITPILLAALTACALIALSGYVRAFRTGRASRDFNCWCGPLAFTSAAVALLTATAAEGVAGLLAGAVLAVVPLAVIARKSLPVWRSAAKTKLGKGRATLLILKIVLDRVRDSAWNFGEDLRDLAGLLRRGDGPAAETAASAPPVTLAALRTVPSVRDNPNLGTAPTPADVAAGLTAAGTVVPPEWQAVVNLAAEFDPDSQDDLEEHMAGEAAGLLAWSDAQEARAQGLLEGRKLHPRYVAALIEVADGAAELATLAAMANRAYHEAYGDVEDWHADGNELPDDARNWGFGSGT